MRNPPHQTGHPASSSRSALTSVLIAVNFGCFLRVKSRYSYVCSIALHMSAYHSSVPFNTYFENVYQEHYRQAVCLSHTCTVVRQCCEDDDTSQRGNWKFDPSPRWTVSLSCLLLQSCMGGSEILFNVVETSQTLSLPYAVN